MQIKSFSSKSGLSVKRSFSVAVFQSAGRSASAKTPMHYGKSRMESRYRTCLRSTLQTRQKRSAHLHANVAWHAPSSRDNLPRLQPPLYAPESETFNACNVRRTVSAYTLCNRRTCRPQSFDEPVDDYHRPDELHRTTQPTRRKEDVQGVPLETGVAVLRRTTPARLTHVNRP